MQVSASESEVMCQKSREIMFCFLESEKTVQTNPDRKWAGAGLVAVPEFAEGGGPPLLCKMEQGQAEPQCLGSGVLFTCRLMLLMFMQSRCSEPLCSLSRSLWFVHSCLFSPCVCVCKFTPALSTAQRTVGNEDVTFLQLQVH